MGKDNFIFPIRVLESDLVKLVPFEPALHAEALYCPDMIAHPELWAYMPRGPWYSPASFVAEMHDMYHNPSPAAVQFAVIDKTRPPTQVDSSGQLAGCMSLTDANPSARSVEIGWICLLLSFHRTHVASHAAGLLLRYVLDPEAAGGLGLLRCQWRTHTANYKSLQLADRFGFVREATLRWDVRVKDGVKRHKVDTGRGVPPGGSEADTWRDTAMLSCNFEDWENGGARAKTIARMDRYVAPRQAGVEAKDAARVNAVPVEVSAE